ncbi:ATP-dependent nuclease [Deinococcus aestuarii]|uniref:ATP-dependent nuclease n=1 Tax=Deinococcus aestuarii TaxID=2774531 RepID=UPI001C0DA088|nr:AAA family ATPase [Deinococcus aestuarii]
MSLWTNRVKSIKFQAFRQIQGLELSLYPRMTTLIGLNGSGKSSILEAIAARQCSFEHHVVGLSMVTDPPKTVDRLISDAILGPPAPPPGESHLVEAQLVVFDEKESREVQALLQQDRALAQSIAGIFAAILGDDTGQVLEVQPAVEPGGPLTVHVLRNGLRQPLYRNSKGTIEIAILAILIGSRRALAEERTRQEDRRLKLATRESRRLAIGGIGGATRSKWNPYGRTKQNTIGHSGGVHRITTQPGLLLLDEPAVSLHPGAQEKLLAYLRGHAQLQQVVMATHSPLLIDLESDRHSGILAIELEGGQVQARPLNQARDHRALLPWREALGLDLTRQVLLEHPTLLVEGNSDQHYLSVMSGFCGAALRPGTGVVQGSGTRRMVPTVAALASFDQARARPSELIVLLDSDMKNTDADQVERMVARVVRCGDHARPFGPSGKRLGEIEDLFEPQEYLELFLRRYPHLHPVEIYQGGPPPLGRHIRCGQNSLPKAITAMLEQVGDPLANENFHAEVSQQLVNDPSLVGKLGLSDNTKQRFASLIEAINQHVDEIRASRQTQAAPHPPSSRERS